MVNRDWLKTSVQNIYGSPSLACRWTNTGCKPAIMTTRKNTSALHPIPTLVTVAHLWPNNRIDLPYTRALNTHARYGKGGWGVWLKTDLVMTMSNEVQGEHEWRSDTVVNQRLNSRKNLDYKWLSEQGVCTRNLSYGAHTHCPLPTPLIPNRSTSEGTSAGPRWSLERNIFLYRSLCLIQTISDSKDCDFKYCETKLNCYKY